MVTGRGPFRLIPVGGSDYGGGVRYAAQWGGTGGRIIGEAWGLGRDHAEEFVAELNGAFEAGTEANVEA